MSKHTKLTRPLVRTQAELDDGHNCIPCDPDSYTALIKAVAGIKAVAYAGMLKHPSSSGYPRICDIADEVLDALSGHTEDVVTKALNLLKPVHPALGGRVLSREDIETLRLAVGALARRERRAREDSASA